MAHKRAIAPAQAPSGDTLTADLVGIGLLVGGAILAVTAAGTNLSAAWTAWGGWWTGNLVPPPAA